MKQAVIYSDLKSYVNYFANYNGDPIQELREVNARLKNERTDKIVDHYSSINEKQKVTREDLICGYLRQSGGLA